MDDPLIIKYFEVSGQLTMGTKLRAGIDPSTVFGAILAGGQTRLNLQ